MTKIFAGVWCLLDTNGWIEKKSIYIYTIYIDEGDEDIQNIKLKIKIESCLERDANCQC